MDIKLRRCSSSSERTPWYCFLLHAVETDKEQGVMKQRVQSYGLVAVLLLCELVIPVGEEVGWSLSSIPCFLSYMSVGKVGVCAHWKRAPSYIALPLYQNARKIISNNMFLHYL
jgi:hypothetical protein